MGRIQRDTLLGLVFFGTMAFLLWATVNLTDISFGETQSMRVFFEQLGGIKEGDATLLRGMRVGKVDEFAYVPERPDHTMRVTLRLNQPVRLTTEYRIVIEPSSVLGGKQVAIDPGNGAPLPPDTELIGILEPDALASAGRFFEGSGPAGQELRGLLVEARRFMAQLNEAETTIGALTQRRELYDELLESVQSVRRLLSSVEDGEGLLGRLFKDRTLGDDAMRLMANLAELSERLKGTDGLVPRLINDREMADGVSQIVRNVDAMVADLREGRGALGRILRDEGLAQQLDDALSSLASVLRKADDPEAGVLGALLASREMRDDLAATVAGLRSVVAKIDTGKGVLGVLINDEDMGIRLRRIFTQVSRALEDAREAAPIGSFVQVLFGVF